MCNLICAFCLQPQHSAQWSCVRTTRVWPLTSALWGLSPPTTSLFNNGHLFRILLWVNLVFLMEKMYSFAPPSEINNSPSGAWLLWHIHGKATAVHVSSKPGVHHPSCLQSQRAAYFWHGHPLSAGKTLFWINIGCYILDITVQTWEGFGCDLCVLFAFLG